MTITKPIIAAGLLLAVISSAKAVDPTAKLMHASTKGGLTSIQVWGMPNGDFIQSAGITLKVDATKLTLPTANTTNSTTGLKNYVPGDGWTLNDFSAVGDTVTLVLTNSTDDPGGTGRIGQGVNGPIVTVNNIPNTSAKMVSSVVSLDPSSSIGDDQFGLFPVPAQTAQALPGQYKNLGGAISGAPSVGPGGVVAVVAGNALNLIKAADMSPIGATLPLGSAISGRPAFAVLNGAPAVAVADDAGKITVVDPATGAAVGSAINVTGATKLTTPAIDAAGTIYVSGMVGTAPTLVKIAGGAQSSAPMTGASVKGDAAAFGGLVAAGTDTDFMLFRDTGAGGFVQQATTHDTAGFSSAAILDGKGNGLAASAGGTIYSFNAITGTFGANSITAPAGSAPFSDPWYDGTTDSFIYGGNNGHLITVKLGASPTDTAFLSNPIATQPITLGADTYAIDNGGNLKSTAGVSIPLGAPAARALAATGRTAGTDSLIVATTDGGVAVLPF